MRLMTIFELAARTQKELQVLSRQATEDAANGRLPATEREGAMATLANIAHLRVTAPPRVLSAEVVLKPAGPRSRHRHYFKRESLHELVRTAPVLEVAKRLGVSDVGLAKLCRRAEIPTPGRGYWARVESGQRIGRPPLPPAPESLPELLRIRGTEPPPAPAPAPAPKISEAA
jgi:hypothetical protein